MVWFSNIDKFVNVILLFLKKYVHRISDTVLKNGNILAKEQRFLFFLIIHFEKQAEFSLLFLFGFFF